jgi:hypothetical protein
MWCRIRQIFSWLLLVGALVLLIFIGLGGLNAKPAAADIRRIDEAENQVLYQSRQKLVDRAGNAWRAVAFKRIRPDGDTSFQVRLVGFPGRDRIDHSQPLKIRNVTGKTLEAEDVTEQAFADVETGAPDNVGQYDLKPILDDLPTSLDVELILPTRSGSLELPASPVVMQEWQKVADRG